MSHDHDGAACAECPLVDRRMFLSSALLALGALAATGATPGGLAAMSVGTTRPLARSGRSLSYPIPDADGARIDKEAQVILVRWQGFVYAFALSCPHQNTALRWREDDARFQCPKHKSKYRPDGTFISGRATRSMDRFAVRRDGGTVVVDEARLYRQDEDPEGWASAAVAV